MVRASTHPETALATGNTGFPHRGFSWAAAGNPDSEWKKYTLHSLVSIMCMLNNCNVQLSRQGLVEKQMFL